MTPHAAPFRLMTLLGPRPWLSRLTQGQPWTLATWMQRQRSRADLRALDPHMLRDIGLDWAEAKAEAQKPFWRA